MREPIRLFFSAIWFVATGCVFASGLAFILTLGGYATYLFWSLGIWVVATAVVVISALD